MPATRRDFLTRLATGAAAATILPTAFPTAAAASVTDTPFGARTVHETFGAWESASVADEWDISWTRKLTGKHKAVFDSPDIESGLAVIRSGLWQKQYAEVLKAAPADINSVIVLRHHAIILAMAQPFWDEYDLGRKHKVIDPISEKKTSNNPALLSEATGAPPPFAALALDRQMANGAIVLACGLAFSQMIGEVFKKHNLKGDEAHARAMAGLIPGIIMQPSGFFATTLAQENGCIYVRAS